jgi:formylglycine-generating enzyme required for sulfatase activity
MVPYNFLSMRRIVVSHRIVLALAGLTAMASCGGRGPLLGAEAADGAIDTGLPGSDGSPTDGGADSEAGDSGRDAFLDDGGHDAAIDGPLADGSIDSATWDGSDGALSDGGHDAGDGGDGAPATPGQWILVPAGSFIMGSPEAELGGRPDEELLHSVTLSNDYWMMAAEITHDQFEATMGYNPSSFPGGADYPVEQATWHEFAAYANELSLLQGIEPCYECSGSAADSDCVFREGFRSPYACPGYRLPTEAEWEFAARAGTTTATSNGDLDRTDCGWSTTLEPIAWYCDNAGNMTQGVAQKESNPWGFFDLLGNVAEWCHDWFGDYSATPVTDPAGPATGTHRLLRGGAWNSSPGNVRAARRSRFAPSFRSSNFGARLVLTAGPWRPGP